MVMVAMLFVILFQPNRWPLQGRQEKKGRSGSRCWSFAVGAYGGSSRQEGSLCWQPGAGLRFDVVRGNAVKVLIILPSPSLPLPSS